MQDWNARVETNAVGRDEELRSQNCVVWFEKRLQSACQKLAQTYSGLTSDKQISLNGRHHGAVEMCNRWQ